MEDKIRKAWETQKQQTEKEIAEEIKNGTYQGNFPDVTKEGEETKNSPVQNTKEGRGNEEWIKRYKRITRRE